MPKHIYLALVLHNNQPLGNFASVYEENFERAYEPIIALLERYPTVHLTLHYTGSLLDWLKENRPEFIERVRELVQRKQIEILGGGYYEPILASIPDDDKLGQIKKLSAEVQRLFGSQPEGLWLAERIWEPGLAKPLSEAGMKYTVLDDTHFKMAGLEEAATFGYYLTEEQGRSLGIFACPQALRYAIPWEPVDKTLQVLRQQISDTGSIAAMGDDGEKFGGWPGTYELVYEQGWLENLFKAIEQNQDWLRTTTLRDYYQTHPPLGRIYLPTASYAEMLEWALPAPVAARYHRLKTGLQEEAKAGQALAAEALHFIRGGMWRNFLVKYPEVNTQHKKMYHVHRKVKAMKKGETRTRAEDFLWQGQCNETYWHGLFGGVYLPHLRTATYAALIQAENMADEAHHKATWIEAEQLDFDYDGQPEILISGNIQNFYFDPADGAALFEWDFRPRAFNLLNVLTRRPEAYHEGLLEKAAEQAALIKEEKEEAENPEADPQGRDRLLKVISSHKEAGLANLLYYDAYRRASFLDHFLGAETDLEDFYRSDYDEAGDFIGQPYEFKLDQNKKGTKVRLLFRREGQVRDGTELKPVRVEKYFVFEAGSNTFEVTYTVTNLHSNLLLNTIFGFETNYGLNSGHADDSFYTINHTRPENAYLDSKEESAEVQTLSLENGWFKLRVSLDFDRLATLWRLPIETVQNSEGGFERVYQASCLLPHWSLSLDPQQSWQTTIKFKLSVVS